MQYLQMVNMQMLMKQHKGPSKDMAIDFDKGTEEIEIAGTEMISEFGSGDTTSLQLWLQKQFWESS